MDQLFQDVDWFYYSTTKTQVGLMLVNAQCLIGMVDIMCGAVGRVRPHRSKDQPSTTVFVSDIL